MIRPKKHSWQTEKKELANYLKECNIDIDGKSLHEMREYKLAIDCSLCDLDVLSNDSASEVYHSTTMFNDTTSVVNNISKESGYSSIDCSSPSNEWSFQTVAVEVHHSMDWDPGESPLHEETPKKCAINRNQLALYSPDVVTRTVQCTLCDEYYQEKEIKLHSDVCERIKSFRL